MKEYLIDHSAEVVQGKGKNVIPPPEKEPLWRAYLRTLTDPLIMVLLAVFVLSVGICVYELMHGEGMEVAFEPLGVLIAILLATGVGFIFEVKAAREFDVLNQTNDRSRVKVMRRRSGTSAPRLLMVERQDVCLGDIVRLESGDEVPADGELVDSHQLRINESAFTGEPTVIKSHLPELQSAEATFPTNHLLRGCTVMEGTALLRVTAVGVDTEEGRGAMKVREGRDVQTPLNRQLSLLGKQVSIAAIVVGVFIVVGRLLLIGIDPHVDFEDAYHLITYILQSLMVAVTLVVVSVPEGLPMSITLSLALSMRKMLRENNLVRHLHACETMGAATVICTDKTGTLTQNKMTVVESAAAAESPLAAFTPSALVQLIAAVNSTAEISLDAEGNEQALGNPTECALLRWLQEQGADYNALREQYPILERESFTSERKYMSTTVTIDGHRVTLLKGASEILCPTHNMGEQLAEWQAKAMRTLGFAVRVDDAPAVLVGIVAIMDPLRDDVKDAINVCTQQAGVRVIIVTGDTVGTATEIGRQIGLISPDTDALDGAVITGPEWASLTDEEAFLLLGTLHYGNGLKIIARARPDDKARLVQILQRQGHVVAVTGDGTNDAPALAKAQVGLSMGDGTAHAKEASDITIIDNAFSSINSAILWGRSLYQNIRRFLLFQLTINITACFIVLIGAFTGTESPLTVTQMLWVNLIMDTFAAMALSSLPADHSVMHASPRRPDAHILDLRMILRVLWVGGLMFGVLTLMWHYLQHHDVADFTAVVSQLLNEGRATVPTTTADVVTPYEMGIFFTTFVVLQFWNLFNARYYRTSRSLVLDIIDTCRHRRHMWEHFSQGFLLIAVAIILGQVLITECAWEFFQMSPISCTDWFTILGVTSVVLLIPDAVRTIMHLRK